MVSASVKSRSDNWQLLGLEMPWLAAMVFVVTLVLWIMIGWLPIFLERDLFRAGVMGDSFGMVNSLFSGFGFMFAAYAIILQIRESHSAAALQQEQQRLLDKQTRIAKETARIQRQLRRDSRRTLELEAFLKLSKDLLIYRTAFLAKHPGNWRLCLAEDDGSAWREAINRFKEAGSELLSDCLCMELLFGERGNKVVELVGALQAKAMELHDEESGKASQLAECVTTLDEYCGAVNSEIRSLWNTVSFADFGFA